MPLHPVPSSDGGRRGRHEASPGPAASDLDTASNGELRALVRFAEATSGPVGRAAVAALLLEAVVSAFGFPRGAVLEGSSRLSVLVTHGLDDRLGAVGPTDVVRRIQDVDRPEPVILDEHLQPWLSQFCPPGSHVLVHTLTSKGRRFGALVLQVPSSWGARDLPALRSSVERIAAMASTVMLREQRVTQLERLATTDDLTKIPNRRSFDASLERELARAARGGGPLSVAVLDLDLFKQVNDVHGHPAGDDLLRNVAAALAGACRELDTPARYGGEEFAVILPDCASTESMRIVERLRQAVASAPGARRVTASAGVATYPDDASTAEDLVSAADLALLAAKNRGRDRTVVAGESSLRDQPSDPQHGPVR